jgi:hypothetical protein
MKRLLVYLIVVLGLGLVHNLSSNAKEINKDFYKLKKISIPLSKNGTWKLIGVRNGSIHGANFTWKYLAQLKDNKLSRLIEVLHVSPAPESASLSLEWFKNFTFQKNGYKSCIPNNGNNQSSKLRENYYVYEILKKSTTNCFFTRNMNIEEEVVNPTIKRQTEYVNTNHFSKVLKEYIGNEIKFPKIMLRSDHYFYSYRGLYAYFEMINPDINGAPKTLFSQEKESEYHPSNIDNYPKKKIFYLNWIKIQAKKHSDFENQIVKKQKFKLNLAKYIGDGLFKVNENN